MKEFNLEAALSGAKVVTRDGRDVKVAGYNEDADPEYYIIGWIGMDSYGWNNNGSYLPDGENAKDLFMAPTERKEWVVIWRDKEGNPIQSTVMQEKPSGIENATIHEITIIE